MRRSRKALVAYVIVGTLAMVAVYAFQRVRDMRAERAAAVASATAARAKEADCDEWRQRRYQIIDDLDYGRIGKDEGRAMLREARVNLVGCPDDR